MPAMFFVIENAGWRRLWPSRRSARRRRNEQGRHDSEEESGFCERGKPAGDRVFPPHLVSERAAELSSFEYGLYVASNAFERWIVRCMAAAGQPGAGAPLDVMVVHSVNHRARDKRLADICFVLNIEDSHTVNYALKKLSRLGLVAGEKRGKEIFYATTKEGEALCLKYREVREACLVNSFSAFAGSQGEDLNEQIGPGRRPAARPSPDCTIRRQGRRRVSRGDRSRRRTASAASSWP